MDFNLEICSLLPPPQMPKIFWNISIAKRFVGWNKNKSFLELWIILEWSLITVNDYIRFEGWNFFVRKFLKDETVMWKAPDSANPCRVISFFPIHHQKWMQGKIHVDKACHGMLHLIEIHFARKNTNACEQIVFFIKIWIQMTYF